ncbi:MAG: Carbapenam-3-carboxylate synthase [Sodalis sp.]|nr:MAG: Carbapenam-3-carboxylate synthase [Sodalis sp.]
MLRNNRLFSSRKTLMQSFRFASCSAYLIGLPHNKQLLRHLATHFTGGYRAEVLYQFSMQLGQATLSLAEGDFCFFEELTHRKFKTTTIFSTTRREAKRP